MAISSFLVAPIEKSDFLDVRNVVVGTIAPDHTVMAELHESVLAGFIDGSDPAAIKQAVETNLVPAIEALNLATPVKISVVHSGASINDGVWRARSVDERT